MGSDARARRAQYGVLSNVDSAHANRRFLRAVETDSRPFDEHSVSGKHYPCEPAQRSCAEVPGPVPPLPTLPNGLFSGNQRTSVNRNQYVGRVDHELSPNDRIFARYLMNRDSSLVNRGSFTDWYQDQHFTRQALTVNQTRTFTPTLLNSFSFTFNRVVTAIDIIPHFDWTALGPIFGYGSGSKGLDGGRAPGILQRSEWRSVEREEKHVSVRRYCHVDSRKAHYASRCPDRALSNRTVLRVSLRRFDELLRAVQRRSGFGLRIGPGELLRQASPGLNSLRQTLWGFFFSDDIRLTSRLTLNAGLRYEPYFGFRELTKMRPDSVRAGSPWCGPPRRQGNCSRAMRGYQTEFSNPTGITLRQEWVSPGMCWAIRSWRYARATASSMIRSREFA